MTAREKRMATERQVVRHLIRTAKKHGFALTRVYDGGESAKCSDEAAAMEVVFSVDESIIYFKHPDQPKGHCAVIVLGNDGWDAIADCSVGELWDEVTQECNEYADKLEAANT
jgi:hypothetical protein